MKKKKPQYLLALVLWKLLTDVRTFEIELTTYQFEDITTIYLEGRETILKIPDIFEYFMPV